MESTIGCVESSLSAIDRDSGDTVSDAPTADGYCTFQSIDISTLQLEKLCLDGEMESGDVMVVEEESEKGDVFLYLELPEDIHRLLFKKHLSTADRLRARVTTGLVKIEAEERYDYVRLNIVDDVNYKMNSCCIKNIDCVNMILTKSSEIYMDGLHKIASNSTFEHIVFDLDGPAYGDLLPVVAGIPSSRLTVSIENESLSRDLLTEDRLVQLADGRESVSIRKTVPSLTTDVLRRFYQMMETGDGTVNEYCFYSVPSSIGREFYCSLGLCFSCHCTNRQIHGVYHGACFIFVLIGRCVIYFSEELFEGEEGGMINIQRFNDDGESPGAHFIIPKRTIEELCNIPITYIDGGHVHGEEEEDEEEEEEEGEENEDEEELSDDGWVEEEDTADEEEEGEE